MAVDYDSPRTAQGALPASMASASTGMAASILPTQQNLGQLMYQRYYPAIYYVGYMEQAVTAAEANPYVDSANTLLAEAQGLQKRSDARRAELVSQQKALLASRAKLHAARMKAGGKSDIKYLELALDAVKAMEGIDVSMDAARMERLGMGGVGDRMAQVDTYGDISALSQGARSAIEAIAGVVERNTATTADSARIADIAATEGGAALQGIKALEDPLARGSAARALAVRLERSGKMSPDKAAAFAADYMGLSDLPQLATAAGATQVRQQLKSTVNEAVVGSGIGEDDLPRQRALAGEVMRAALNRIGAGSGAAAAYSAREKAKELTPQEDADLRLYLAALANDGVITEGGEDVMSGGRRVTLSADDIARGKDAYEKAKKHGTYRADDAAYFDDEFLLTYKEGIDRSELAKQKRLEAMTRAERTPQEVQREAAEHFVRTATAIRDLEDYVPLDAEGVTSSFDATVIGGATHIARREGSGVFDLDAHHPDRKRRLGGTGPIAQAPLRQAQELFMRSGDKSTPMPEAELQQAVQALRNKYKRNPEKLEKAVQYLFAMQVVSMKAQEAGRDVPPVERAEDRPPAPPPVEAPPRADGREEADTDAWKKASATTPARTGAGASRAAQPAAVGGESFNMMEGVEQPFMMTGAEVLDPLEAQFGVGETSALPPGESEYAYADEDAVALDREKKHAAGALARQRLYDATIGRIVTPTPSYGGAIGMQAAASRRADVAAQQKAADQQALVNEAALPPIIGGVPGSRQVGEVLTDAELLERQLYLSGVPAAGRP